MQKLTKTSAIIIQSLDRTQNQELVSRTQRSRTHRSLLLPLVALATLCLSTPMRADEQVPFKGTFLPIVHSATQLDQTHLQFEAEIIVVATHIGLASGPGVFTIDFVTLTYSGHSTWIAANGDMIFSTFAGHFEPTETPGLLNNIETFDIVGGTGRFQGATGGGIATGQFDAITQSVPEPAPFRGTISSPGSLKNQIGE